MERTFVVVGAGLAGASAVQTLREEAFAGRIVLVGEEPDPPYERPPLSKEYLRGEQGRAALLVRPEQWYGEQGVELRLGQRVEILDPGARAVELEAGERLTYDAVLLATGGRPRTLPGDVSDAVSYLRTIEDADRIRSYLRPGRHVVVVGAGFIGAEVAASARQAGAEVTMVDMFSVPLERAIGEEMGRVVGEIHRDHGVQLRMDDPVATVESGADGVVVRMASGARIEGDAAVIGVAIRPNSELAEAAGLAVDDGIVVDERCRASADGVFAAGDVANHQHPLFGRRIRVEHFDNAIKQGAAAARSMLGETEPFDDPHWFWSDQYDVNLQYVGSAVEWDRIVVRGSTKDRNFVAFYLKDGVVLAALGLDRGRDVRRAMRLVTARARPDPAALRDPEVDLRTLVSRSSTS